MKNYFEGPDDEYQTEELQAEIFEETYGIPYDPEDPWGTQKDEDGNWITPW